jgi:hypothetical protein
MTYRACLLVAALSSLVLSGCPDDPPATPIDAGHRDAGHRDAGQADAAADGGVDAGPERPCRSLAAPAIARPPEDGRLPADLFPPC